MEPHDLEPHDLEPYDLKPHVLKPYDLGVHVLKPYVLGVHEIGRRQALGLLGALGVGVGSQLFAGDSGSAATLKPAPHLAKGLRQHRRTPPVTPAPARPANTPGPVAVWNKPARSVHDLKPDAPKNAVALTIDD